MSRLTELKIQYPALGYSIIDFFELLDISGRRKYLPLFCKLLKDRIVINDNDYKKNALEQLSDVGIDITKIPDNKIFISNWFIDLLGYDRIKTFIKFMNHMENNRIDKKDVTSYESIDELSFQISKAELKFIEKCLSKQVYKEYEDDNWVVIRPLTFESSRKYGASTTWCTTSDKHPSHFVKYWKNGILVYFINKLTGYKFAGFKELHGQEFSFWDVQDNRLDSLQLHIEDYMYGIIKKIFSSTQSNENLSSDEQKKQVYKLEKLRENQIRPFEPFSDEEPMSDNLEESTDTYVIRYDYLEDME